MDLVYTVAAGKRRFRWAAALALRCLRRHGRFDGELVVLGDRARERDDDGIRWIRCAGGPGDAAKWWKIRAGELIDFPRYERVCFIDCDIAVRTPLDELLARIEPDRLLVTDDMQHRLREGFCCRCLSEAELAEHGDRRIGVNSGFFAARGRDLPGFLQSWRATLEDCADRPGGGFDQPGLNAAILRGLIAPTLVEGLMWFPKRDPDCRRAAPDAPLVHFHGIGRHLNRYFRMRRFVRGLDARA